MNLDPEDLPSNLVSISATVPDAVSIEAVSVDRLPKSWRKHPAPESLQEIGSDRVGGSRTAVLSVPSAVIPHERNYIINPANRQFSEIVVHSHEPFHFDPRMWK